MINEIAAYFENMGKGLGCRVKIPRPSQSARSLCSTTNGLIGLTLIGTGAVLKKPSLIALGALGIAGAVVLSLDE